MTAAPMPLAEQLAKLERILKERVRFYKLGVSKERLSSEVGATKHRECQDIYRSFRRYVVNADWIDPEIERRRAHAEALAEAERDPLVAELREHFPGATLELRELPHDPPTLVDAIEQEPIDP